eukprot:6565615-Prymnesium_polylepis.1
MAGSARSRKLHKLHTSALAATSALASPPEYCHIARQSNARADALSRAAVEGMQALHCAAIRSTLRCGRRSRSLHLLEGMRRQNVPRPKDIFDDIVVAADEASDWDVVLRAFAEAQECGAANSPVAIDAALRAYTARGAPQDAKLHAALVSLHVPAPAPPPGPAVRLANT